MQRPQQQHYVPCLEVTRPSHLHRCKLFHRFLAFYQCHCNPHCGDECLRRDLQEENIVRKSKALCLGCLVHLFSSKKSTAKPHMRTVSLRTFAQKFSSRWIFFKFLLQSDSVLLVSKFGVTDFVSEIKRMGN